MIDKNKYITNELYSTVRKYAEKIVTRQHKNDGKEYWLDDVINESFLQYLTKTKVEKIEELQNRPNPTDAIGRYIRGIILLLWIDKKKSFTKMIWENPKELTYNLQQIPDKEDEYNDLYADELRQILIQKDFIKRKLLDEYILSDLNYVQMSKNTGIPRNRLMKYIKEIINEIKEEVKGDTN